MGELAPTKENPYPLGKRIGEYGGGNAERPENMPAEEKRKKEAGATARRIRRRSRNSGRRSTIMTSESYSSPSASGGRMVTGA